MKKLFMILSLVFLLCFTFSCQQGEEVAEETRIVGDMTPIFRTSFEANFC